MQRHAASRRDVLKLAASASAAVAFPMVVPSTVFGQDAPSNRVNIALIGCGGRGTGNVNGTFLPQAAVRVVAGCDVSKQRREAYATAINNHYKQQVCRPVADFRDVLADKSVDGVVIATQDHWHVPLAYYAAVAKKDMYVEKPLGVAMAWAWKLREIVEKNKVIFQYGTQQRGDQRQFRRACELVRNGYIGKVTRAEAWCPDMSTQFDAASKPPYGSTEAAAVPEGFDYQMWVGPAPMKPYTKDRCTCFGGYHIYDYALGFIAGWGVHPVDIVQWGLDADNTSPILYEGTGKIPPAGSLWDTVESWDVNCTYASGVVLRFMGSRVAQPVVSKYRPWRDHGTTFFGDKGWISVDRAGLYASDKAIQQANIKDTERQLYAVESQAKNFVECMRTRKPTINPLESAIRCDTISHLSDVCIRLGRPIRWNPEKEQIINDAEAVKYLDRPLRDPWKLA